MTQNVVESVQKNMAAPTAIVVSFDTTGSMSPCIAQVRQHLRDLVSKMKQDIPDLRMGFISHGDYCDGDRCISVLDLTDDVEQMINFINNTPNTSGGDAPECYEFALHKARSMSWPAEGGSLLLIGDDEPHPPEYQGNNLKLDWREEVAALKGINVAVFPLQCLRSRHRQAVNAFWEEVAKISQTPWMELESFRDSAGTLEEVAYASAGTKSAGGAAAYHAREMKVASDMAAGVVCRSANLCSNTDKLKDWASNVASDLMKAENVVKTETTTTTDVTKTE